MSKAPRPLVIGIGNVLRGDDGAGFRVAEALRDAKGHQCEVIALHQLTPELALRIAAASRVLFVDASLDPERTGLEPLPPAAGAALPLAHELSPQTLMAMARLLYGQCPPAWQLLLPAWHWEHGMQLSAITASACERALPIVQAWEDGHA